VKQKLPQIAIWAIALFLAVRLTWTAHQHHMPLLDTITIALASTASARLGIDALTRAFTAARNTPKGADQS
jgi:hypothetical protein